MSEVSSYREPRWADDEQLKQRDGVGAIESSCERPVVERSLSERLYQQDALHQPELLQKRDTVDPSRYGLPSSKELLAYLGESFVSAGEGTASSDSLSKDNFLKHLKKLGADDFDEREAAQEALNQLSVKDLLELNKATASKEDPGGVLLAALKSDDLEVKTRAQRLVATAVDKVLDKHTPAEWQLAMSYRVTPMPKVLVADMTALEAKQVGTTMSELARLVHPVWNKADVDRLNTQAESWNDLDKTRSSIKDLIVRGRDLHKNDLAGLSKLTDLQSLTVTGADNETINALPQLKNLQKLEIAGIADDNGLENLAGFTGLKRLKIESDELVGHGLKHVRGLSKLEALDVPSYRMRDVGLKQLEEMTNLRELTMGSIYISDDGMTSLSSLKSLTSLKLIGHEITNAGFNQLQKLQQLKDLSIRGNFGDESLPTLNRLGKLETLAITSPGITSSGLKKLLKDGPDKLGAIRMLGLGVDSRYQKVLGSWSEAE